MYKIALVNPNKFEGIASAAPPINLGILASYLRKHLTDINIKIIDGMAGQDIKGSLLEYKPDLVGLTSTTPTILRAYDLADWIRPNVKPQDALIICDTMPREEFIKLYNDIARQVGEVIYYNKIHDNNVPLFKTALHLLKKEPLALFTYPFKHPVIVLKIVSKKFVDIFRRKK